MRIAVIGGGVYGTAIAHFLASVGDPEVVLFEKGALGSASTGKSAGIVRHHYSEEVQIRFAKRGREIIETMADRWGVDVGFHQNGYLIVADEANEDQFRRNVAMQSDIGLDVDLLEPDELQDYVPEMSSEGISVGAIEREAGFADPYLVATGFAQLAEDRGVDVRTNTPVRDLQCDDGEVVALETPDGRETVDFVVNAAGPWARDIGAMVGLDLPLKRYEAKVVTLSASREYGPDRPTVSDIGLGLYAKPEASGNFIAGGMERENGHEAISGREELEGVTNDNLQQLGRMIETRLPGYGDAEVVETWSELITASPDWHQIIGVPDGYENFYVAAGGSGHGFKEAPGFAESIAQDVLGEDPRIDLHDYRPQRFDEGETFSSGYGDGSRS